jgi:tetratricopeptide (TPR) repeat protein
MNADDPKWTSFILGELEAEEKEAIRRQIESNPAAIERVEEIREISALIQESLNEHSPLEFTPEERQAILAAAGNVRSGRRWLHFPHSIRGIAVAVTACVVLFAVVAVFRMRLDRTPPTRKQAVANAPVTAMIADFSNNTGEAVFDNALAPVVRTALEEAGFITAYDRTTIGDLGLRPITGKLDEQAARNIALAQGLRFVISGSLDHQGSGYRLSIKATQAPSGDTIQTMEGAASQKGQVQFETTKVVGALRTALGDDTSKSAKQDAKTLTATSLEAVEAYAIGREAMTNGKFDDALKSFSKAIDADSRFGLAYFGMATASTDLGKRQDAMKYFRLALSYLDSMTERDRFRVRSSYYMLLGDWQKCAEENSQLVERFPSDAVGHNNLAVCLSELRQMGRALEQARQAADILPKRMLYRNHLALYASYAADFATAEREAEVVLETDPSFYRGYISLAFAQLGQGRSADAAETYRRLERTSAIGSSDASAGLADIALYEGRFEDAVRILEQGISTDLAANYSDRAATKVALLANVHLSQNKKRNALEAALRARNMSTTPKIRFLAGRVFAAANDAAAAKTVADELVADLQNESQAYGRLIEGEVALANGDAPSAINAFNTANALLDTWIGHFDLGRAYLQAGAFAEALSEFDQCIKRRGEALSLFLDEVPTYGYLPPVYDYLRRTREALHTSSR